MNSESLSRLDAFLSASATELFASHGAALRPVHGGAIKVEDPFVATIGFTAPSMRGVLVMNVGRFLAMKSLPRSLAGASQGPEILADWTGELSNQMLGRLKNRFHATGIDIALSTPMVFFGPELMHICHRLPLSRSMSFDGDGRLVVEFQADFEEGLELVDGEGPLESGPPEGEVLFF